MTTQASTQDLGAVAQFPEIAMPDLEITAQSLQIQDQTGYVHHVTSPQATCLPVAPPVFDDTGLDASVVLDVAEDCRQQTVPSIQLLGERFNVELDDELGVVISHPRWSLMGYGRSLAEADKMLMNYAQDLAESIVDDSPFEYTDEGNRMRDFVLGFLYLSSR